MALERHDLGISAMVGHRNNTRFCFLSPTDLSIIKDNVL